MKLYLKSFGAILVVLILQRVKAEIPGCHILETVNISASQRLPNGSYLYQDLEVPVNFTGEYNYTKTERGLQNTVEEHLRGCVCELKPCLWFCCRFKDLQTNGECNDGLMEDLHRINPYINVTLSNGSVVRRNVLKDFIVLRDQMRLADKWNEDGYTLYENGSILLGSLKKGYHTMVHRGYDCLHPNQFSSGNADSLVVAFHDNLYQPSVRPGENELILLSEVLLILTIAVYLSVKKLRNLQGKCFVSYMICTFMFLLYAWLVQFHIPKKWCALEGYLNYFFFMAKFIWLFVLSLRMWKGLTSVRPAQSEYGFLTYSLLAWGTAALMTGLIVLLDHIWDGETNWVKWVPGVGYEYCDLKQGWPSNNVYVSWPLLLLITLTATLFIWTTISIIRVKRSLKIFVEEDVRTARIRSRIQAYTTFVRLFIIMDMQWSVRLIVFLANWEDLIEICYYIDYSIGIIIFVLFILKRRTIRLLMKSIRGIGWYQARIT